MTEHELAQAVNRALNEAPIVPGAAPGVPADFPVRPLIGNWLATDPVTCGTCGRTWDNAVATAWTPAPAGRCPFEAFHPDTDATEAHPDCCANVDGTHGPGCVCTCHPDVVTARGTMDGTHAAGWVFDGNTDDETYARVAAGIFDGDPLVLDELPGPDTDDAELLELFPVDVRAYVDPDRVRDAYGDAFTKGLHDELVRVATYQLGDR